MHLPIVTKDALLQGNAVWKMEVPEELLSPRSRLAASAARRMAQGLSRGAQNLGNILGNFGSFLAGTALHCIAFLLDDRVFSGCHVLIVASGIGCTVNFIAGDVFSDDESCMLVPSC